MRVVVVGASGLLGQAVAVALAARGVELLCTARDPVRAQARAPWPLRGARWVAVDWGAPAPVPVAWCSLLREGDVVLNAAGILREARAGDFEAVHHLGPADLFAACAAQGVRRVIHLSALGAQAEAPTGYFRSKWRGEERLRATAVPSVIVRPSLVWAESGASARLFAALAVLPVLALPAGGRQVLQPVHLDDLVDGVVALVMEGAPPPASHGHALAFVGPQPVLLRDYLASLRRQLGARRQAWVLPLPAGLFMGIARLAGRHRGSLLDGDAARMLLQGNAADARPFAGLLRRPPRGHGTFVAPGAAQPLWQAAWLGWGLPLLRLAIAAVWIWTFAVSIGLYPRDQSLALLARVGAHGAWAELLLAGAALADLALGVATLALRRAWRVRLLWPLQLALMGFYTAVITVALPEQWLHPFGPLSKNLPMAAAIALLWALEGPSRSRQAA